MSLKKAFLADSLADLTNAPQNAIVFAPSGGILRPYHQVGQNWERVPETIPEADALPWGTLIGDIADQTDLQAKITAIEARLTSLEAKIP